MTRVASPSPAPASAGALPLPRDLERKVRRIEIATRRLVDEGVAGDYHSVFKGRGVEFREVRPYQPGDDARLIDWNVTARTGMPHVKEYAEERDLTIQLVVDVSGSLSFGSRAISKRELTAELAALFAFAALRNRDRVGAALVSDRMISYLRPERRRSHVLRLVRDVLATPAAGGTDLDGGIRSVLRTLHRRSVLMILSDLLFEPPRRALEMAAARHDLILIEIGDPRDRELPQVGPVPLRDAETGELAVVSGARMARRHARRMVQMRREWLDLARRVEIDYLELSTSRPYLPTLSAFFERRRQRMTQRMTR